MSEDKIAQMSYAGIQEELAGIDLTGYEELHISVIRNIMLEPIEPYIRYLAYRSGFNAQVQFGEYDSIVQEAVGEDSRLFNRKTDCIMVFARFETLAPDLVLRYSALQHTSIKREVERVKDYINSVLDGIRKQSEAMILWQAFELPIEPAYGIWDSQTNEGQLSVVRYLNEYLRESLFKTLNGYFVDINLCQTRIGSRKFYDHRYWHIGRAPYSREALCEIAIENDKYLRALKGRNKKCLVLDCDNTLWGGVVGEDLISGIKLGKTYPGSAYHEFQQQVLNLYHRGILIALCSKNNEEDVLEVLRNHPDMVLKEEHIAAARINWQDKAINIRQLALELNIGLDSMVFMDDSEFEINLIKRELPEVEAICLPRESAVEYRSILASCDLFDTLTVSEEDKKRGSMYKAEYHRKSARARATDMESYYRSLDMVLEFNLANDFSIPRIAQQTQKTNQFNLTTKRYSEADIHTFVLRPDTDVLTVKLSDRFGDSGVVGTCILKYEKEKAIFDTFLLSCRVLGRGIEDAFISHALKLAKKRGSLTAVGEYYQTRKNAQVSDFYVKQGFGDVDASGLQADKVFHYDLEIKIKPEPLFFKEIHSEIGV